MCSCGSTLSLHEQLSDEGGRRQNVGPRIGRFGPRGCDGRGQVLWARGALESTFQELLGGKKGSSVPL